MRCPKCGTENPKWKDFCHKCGTKLARKAETSVKKEPNVVEPKREYKTPEKIPIQRHEPKPESNPEQPRPSRKPVRPPDYSSRSIDNLGFLKKLPQKYPFLQKVPGFRSKTPWKMISSSVVFVIFFIVIISTVAGMFTNHVPIYQVADSSISVLGNESTTEDGYTKFRAQLLNNQSSSVTILPVQVYCKGEYVGDFFITNVDPNQKISLNMSIPDSSVGISSIQVRANGKSLDFNYADINSNASYGGEIKYSSNPGDYKIVIGNQSAEICKSVINTLARKRIGSSYNKTRGAQTDSIPVKGKITGDYTSDISGNIPANTPVTIFLKLGDGYIVQQQIQYSDGGKVANAYRHYEDVVALSWPDLKIIGWHRFYGEAWGNSGTGGGGDVYGKHVNEQDIIKWINSQPNSNSKKNED